jgi:putative hydrolase of the HAD superfamily
VRSLALFDLDNTLFDRAAAYHRWASRFCSERALPEGSIDHLIAWDGDGYHPRTEVLTRARDAFGLPETTDQLLAAYRLDYPESFAPDQAVLSALRRLRDAGFKIVIVTNGHATQQEKVQLTGLSEVALGCCVSEVIGVSKPSRGIFEAAAAIARSPLDGWMVGDSAEHDIRGGLEAGLDTIWLSRGREWTATDFTPTRVCSSIGEAVDVILSTE